MVFAAKSLSRWCDVLCNSSYPAYKYLLFPYSSSSILVTLLPSGTKISKDSTHGRSAPCSFESTLYYFYVCLMPARSRSKTCSSKIDMRISMNVVFDSFSWSHCFTESLIRSLHVLCSSGGCLYKYLFLFRPSDSVTLSPQLENENAQTTTSMSSLPPPF